jgi:hypothetical protein
MNDLYKELMAYTGLPEIIIKERCGYARFELAYEWYKAMEQAFGNNPKSLSEIINDYYKNTELYIYDLTYYHQERLKTRFYDECYIPFLTEIHRGIGLDYGGGIGEYTIEAMQMRFKMDFFDIDGSKTLKYAKWRFDKHAVKPNICSTIDKNYDFVVAMDVFEHLENPDEAIKEIAQHTKYLFANPYEIPYNEVYPQHISHFDLTQYFNQENKYLWVIK